MINKSYELKSKIGESGVVHWKSPSNIALVKYWGKFGRQYPRNPSLSFTLDAAHTETKISYTVLPEPLEDLDLEFSFEGNPNKAFEDKIRVFFKSISDFFPFLSQLKWEMSSSNSFPHSSGIASSASAMSAIAMCLVDIEAKLFGEFEDENARLKKASLIARLGSGSASRSVYPLMGLWGKMDNVKESSNNFAIPFGEYVDPVFHSFHDDILIVSKKEKSVSSTEGHALMEENIYANSRYQLAFQRMESLINHMKHAQLFDFGKLVEQEALGLHALMMCSNPSYILIEPDTISLINEIRAFRKDSKTPVYFSLDAGPNIHLLYPDADADAVQNFIQTELSQYCKQIIHDQVGLGPTAQ